MKKVLLIFLLVAIGCHNTKYMHSGDVSGAIDFSKGKWLLNDVQAPFDVYDDLSKIAEEKFRELIGDRLSTARKSNNILMAGTMSKNINKTQLKDLKNSSDSDFFIHIQSDILKDDIGSVQIGKIGAPKKNEAEVTVVIYDLNLLQKVYEQSVRGTLAVQKDNADFKLAKSANDIIISGFKRIMKKLEKYKV